MESVGKLPMQKNSNKLCRYVKEVECGYPVFKCGLHTGAPFQGGLWKRRAGYSK